MVKATDNAGNSTLAQTGAVKVESVTKYYSFGAQRVAMRKGNVVYYLHGDHLGSTSLTTDASGNPVSQARYLPYGETRWGGTGPTDFGFTGQRNDSFGLMDYNARFYSPFLGRFVSPDPIIPGVGNPQVLNHYSYVKNNPLRFNDPSGNYCWGQPGCARIGAIIIVAEAADPLPGDIISVPLGVSMIASDPEVGNFLATYGPQLPAFMDTVYQAGQQIKNQIGQYFDKGGNVGGAGPEGPFKNLPKAVQDKIELLKQRSENYDLHNPYRLGAKAQLDATEYYARLGKLDNIEVTFENGGVSGRYDIMLKGQQTIVEVKYWTQSYVNENFDSLVNQLLKYQASGKNVVLEMYKTQTDSITQQAFEQLVRNL